MHSALSGAEMESEYKVSDKSPAATEYQLILKERLGTARFLSHRLNTEIEEVMASFAFLEGRLGTCTPAV